MDKLNMHTQDMSDVNIEKIGSLFPNCLTERVVGKDQDGNDIIGRGIDFDRLRQELSKEIVEGPQERYQFTWPGKREAIRLANTPTNMTLRPDRAGSVDFDHTENLYIEGDNLEVLKLLRENYLGKVKMIYIDPPYNTGNDFVYEDDFSETAAGFRDRSGMFDASGNMVLDRFTVNSESNGRFHTDWLNMMYPRLKVARDLLTEDGVIVISIDDNEIENLRKVCDEIYGTRNFIAEITVIVKTEGRRYGAFAKTHEYLLFYAKSIDAISFNEIEVAGASFDYNDNLGGFNLTDLRNQNARAFNSTNRPNLRYPFYVDAANPDANGFCRVSVDNVDGYEIVNAITVNGIKSVWRWSKEKARMNLDNLIARKSHDGQFRIYQKYRKLTQTAKTVWQGTEFTSNRGTKEIQDILGTGIFDFPKPIALIRQLLTICSNPEDIILDFFSGSATTAAALFEMSLNAEENGRKFILIQLPEETINGSDAFEAGFKTICEIGKERIRRAGRKISADIAVRREGNLFEEGGKPLDTGFRVLKLDTSNMEDVYYRPEEFSEATLFEDNVKPDRSGEDLLFQVMLECNLPLSAKIEKKTIAGKEVFNVNDGYLMACFDRDVNETVITEVAKMKPYWFVMRDSSLSSDNVADNFEQIFKAYSKDTIRKIL